MTIDLRTTPLVDLRLGIVGTSGSGKSYTAKGMVERLLGEKHRLCVVDPTGVWWGLRAGADGSAEGGYPIAVLGGRHGDLAIADHHGEAVGRMVGSRGGATLIDLSELGSGAARRRFMTGFAEALFDTNRQPLTLVLDEADAFAPQRPQRDALALLGRIDEIVRRGRVRGFTPWLITQRPAVLHKDVLSQVDALICMKLTSPQDRAAIGAWVEGQANREDGKRILAALPTLKPGEGYVWAPGLEVLERLRFPAIRTYDSSRTPQRGEVVPDAPALQAIDLEELEGALAEAEESEDDVDLEEQYENAVATEDAADRLQELTRARNEAHQEGYAVGHRKGYDTGWDEGYRLGRQELAGPIAREAEHLSGLKSPQAPPGNRQAAETPAPKPARRTARPLTTPAPTAFRDPHIARMALPSGERRILTALAQSGGRAAKRKVAMLAAYSPNGGGFNNLLSALRGKGWIEGSGELAITAAGRAGLGAYDPLPTGKALHEHWLANCGGRCERAILAELISVHPRPLNKDALASRTGYVANAGGFNNALSRLRTLELIEGKRELRASKELF